MEVTPQEVYQRLRERQDLLLLDVREPWEYSQAHIAGAVLIPLGELQRRLAEVPRESQIVAICHMGSRSGMAASWLQQMGYDVLNLHGGMDAWERGGLPVERGG